uniref:Proton-coupled amino acid transporter-like protein pathetic n=1 Tax=Diabrotica virgifera virgifera TaxID=50390 RepID=A0A6P7GFB5_DIAVI
MTCSCYTVIMAKNFNYVVNHHLGYDVEIRITIAIMMVPLILLAYVPNLKYLAPFSMVANGFMAVGLGITFYYLVINLKPVSEVAMIADVGTMPVFLSITIFAIEAIGVTHQYLHRRIVAHKNSIRKENIDNCPDITKDEVLEAIKRTNSNKVTGPNQVPVEIIKLIV